MKIVVTVPYTPWPVTRGTGRLIINLIEGLSRRHEVTLVTMTLTEGELGRLKELEKPGIKVRAMIAPHRKGASGKLLRKVRNVINDYLRGIPQDVSYSAPPEFLQLIADTASGESVDLVLASYWHMYRLSDYVRGPKLALITHDMDYIVNRERLKLHCTGSNRMKAEKAAARLERIEIEAYRRFDTILTVTASDAEVLKGNTAYEEKKILPLPLALDLSVFAPGAYERDRERILFLGSFYSDFNRDALSFFLSEVFPSIRRELPEAVLEVVGHGTDTNLRDEAGEGVEFTGGVEDIVPHLGRCSLMILPLRFSGGVRIRMMEAAAMGTAVVSTPAGVAGMGLVAGSDYLEAVDADSMARAVISLLRDREEATRLGGNARRWAERSLSMEDYADRLDVMLDSIMTW
jgi:glycosyltransferase involved in cell wall biosynthesis